MNMIEQLEKLQALHAQGALSEEEFALAKKRVIEGATDEASPGSAAPLRNGSSGASPGLHGLHRSRTDKWFGGVCGGLGVMTEIPSWCWRVLFILALLLHGFGLLVYVLMWIFVPLAPAATPAAIADPKPEPGAAP